MEHRWLAIDVDAPALPRKRGRLSLRVQVAVIALLAATLPGGCRQPPPDPGATTRVEVKFPREPSVPRRSIDEVIALYTNDLLAIEGVTVVFAGEDEQRNPVITIGVSEKNEETVRAIPEVLEGYPVVIQETGPVAPR